METLPQIEQRIRAFDLRAARYKEEIDMYEIAARKITRHGEKGQVYAIRDIHPSNLQLAANYLARNAPIFEVVREGGLEPSYDVKGLSKTYTDMAGRVRHVNGVVLDSLDPTKVFHEGAGKATSLPRDRVHKDKDGIYKLRQKENGNPAGSVWRTLVGRRRKMLFLDDIEDINRYMAEGYLKDGLVYGQNSNPIYVAYFEEAQSNREAVWLKRILSAFKKNDVGLIIAGSNHVDNRYGLIDRLQNNGIYPITII